MIRRDADQPNAGRRSAGKHDNSLPWFDNKGGLVAFNVGNAGVCVRIMTARASGRSAPADLDHPMLARSRPRAQMDLGRMPRHVLTTIAAAQVVGQHIQELVVHRAAAAQGFEWMAWWWCPWCRDWRANPSPAEQNRPVDVTGLCRQAPGRAPTMARRSDHLQLAHRSHWQAFPSIPARKWRLRSKNSRLPSNLETPLPGVPAVALGRSRSTGDARLGLVTSRPLALQAPNP
jgi:hypothetical protein